MERSTGWRKDRLWLLKLCTMFLHGWGRVGYSFLGLPFDGHPFDDFDLESSFVHHSLGLVLRNRFLGLLLDDLRAFGLKRS